MRKFEFITPQIEINEVNDRYGMFTITPLESCLLYTSPSPRDRTRSRMPSSA